MAHVESNVGPIEIGGSPSEPEVAAIIAAIEMTWPKPAAVISAPRSTDATWRHSGRWWAEGRLPSTWK